MSAPDVLAVMDRAAPIIGNSDHGDAYAVLTAWPEARAAVAECFAERDRLRNIVRSHEAQILRMTAERAELIEAANEMMRQDAVQRATELTNPFMSGAADKLACALRKVGAR